MSGTLAAVVVVGIGIALVAFSATMLSGMAETPGQQPRAATDVELGPGGITVELEAVGDADRVLVQQNGNLVRELVDPQAGIQTVIEASNVSAGDTITVVGEADGNRVVLDSITLGDTNVAAGSGGGSGNGGSGGGGTVAYDVPAAVSGDVNMPFDDGDLSGDTSGAGDDSAGDSTDASTDDGDSDDDTSTVSVAWTAATVDVQSVQTDGSDSVIAGTDSGSVTTVDRSNGTRTWSVSLGDSAVTDVARSDDAAYASDDGGSIHRIDDAAVNWSVDLGTELDADPTAAVTQVEQANGSTYAVLTDRNDTTSAALVQTGADGSVQWTSTVDSTRITDLDAAADGGAVVTETDRSTADGEHRVRRVAENGTTTWEATLPREPTAVRTVDGQVTVALAANETATSSVWRLHDDGTTAWQYETGAAANVTAITGDGVRTYVALGQPNETVRAIDEDGTQLWQDAIPDAGADGPTGEVTSLSVGPDGDLYAGTPALTRLQIDE